MYGMVGLSWQVVATSHDRQIERAFTILGNRKAVHVRVLHFIGICCFVMVNTQSVYIFQCFLQNAGWATLLGYRTSKKVGWVYGTN